MSDDDHRRMAELLRRCQAKVAVSGYPSEMYDELYQNWRVVAFDIANHSAGGRKKSRETECIWMNF